MPKGKGKFVNHKGKHRSFTNPDELEEERKREEKKREWRAERGEETSSEDENEEKSSSEGSDSEEESSGEEGEGDDKKKGKGVERLIQVENPNRVQAKSKKLSTLNTELEETSSSKPELSRREREEIEKQRAAAYYQHLHAKGKTEEARADLARLAIIKAQREEAAKKRAEESKMKEVEKQKKTQEKQRALGKRT